MRCFIIKTMKIAGIAALYSFVGLLICMTANTCLWEPFLHRYNDDSSRAWPLFTLYYNDLVFLVTLMIAFLAGHSYRPHFQVGGVVTGVAAALLFRFAERTQHSQGKGPSMGSTLLAAAFFGLAFGLLGSVIAARRKPKTSPEPTPR